MFSRISPRNAGFEGFRDPVDVASIPPPPPRNPSAGPDLRQYVRRPPTLNTALSHLQGPTHLATPVTTPSILSSPFAVGATAHALSAGSVPGSALRGDSPANHRLSGNFTNMTYNPQEWTSGRQSVESRQRRDVYGEPLHTPPPPYPEQRSTSSAVYSRPADYTSPNASMNTSPVLQHATVTVDPVGYIRAPRLHGVPAGSRQSYEPRRASLMVNASGAEYVPAPAYHQHSSQQSHLNHPLSFQVSNSNNTDANVLPPPPRRSPPSNVSYIEMSPPAKFSYTRRSTSAGPTANAGPSASRNTRALSGGNFQDHLDRNSTIGLPGPPPLPPPPSSRSRSAGRDSDYEYSGPRQRPPRLYIRDSNLEPIPATPMTAQLESATRSSVFPLRISTGTASGHGKEPVVVSTEPREDSQSSKTGASSLARRSAVRGPAARSSTSIPPNPSETRSKSASGRNEGYEQPLSSALSTNPWASALEQTRSPQDDGMADSSNLLASAGSVDGPSAGQSQTPPVTPGFAVRNALTEAGQRNPQVKVLPTPPLSQKPLLSANSTEPDERTQKEVGQETGEFVAQALQRHAEFLRQEQEACTDVERLALFMAFTQQESLIRKERYMDVFKADGFDIQAAKDMLFKGPNVRRASERGPDISSTEQASTGANTDPGGTNRQDSNWWKEYRPQLSPIASMDFDERSSRGRPPSRWWESATGSQSDGGGHGISRTKRESKYMGLSKKLFQNMENEMQPVDEETPYTQSYPNEKANPETFGVYEQGATVSPPLTARYQQHPSKPSVLDISRFITLPPPYPRHFPAVNNNHPDLAEYRGTVRTLSDLKDAQSRQSRHNASVEVLRADRQKKMTENRKRFRASIQAQIADGSVSYADAAEAERQLRAEENEMEKQGLQAEFDTLQDVVINPLHEQLNERIVQLGHSLESLQRELFTSAANQDPDQPVQEGDDVPELLEQLTQLKWLFEAREVLHQEVFNLLTQRNDAYKAIVALPYQQSKHVEKVRDTDAFFDRDAATRQASFCQEGVKRHEQFLGFMEDKALRGIEMQSSAFWDITPGLVELVQKIAADLNRVQIQIPEQELEENPSYHEHPQQYLYLLLRHAERSSYQYIEAQVNMYCLLHEVKTSSLSAGYRASQARRQMEGDINMSVRDTQVEDEGELTDELKNRATMVEEQWQEALGKQLHVLQERVKKQLQKRGAWEDIAAEAEG